MVRLDNEYRIDVICEDIIPNIVNTCKELFWTTDEAHEKIDNYINNALNLTDSYYEILSLKYIWEKNHNLIDEIVDIIKNGD